MGRTVGLTTTGKTYGIDMTSAQFDTLLRLENAQKKVLEENEDGGEGLNSRIQFIPQADGDYRIVATSYQLRGVGAYTITIREFARKGKAECPEPFFWERFLTPDFSRLDR